MVEDCPRPTSDTDINYHPKKIHLQTRPTSIIRSCQQPHTLVDVQAAPYHYTRPSTSSPLNVDTQRTLIKLAISIQWLVRSIPPFGAAHHYSTFPGDVDHRPQWYLFVLSSPQFNSTSNSNPLKRHAHLLGALSSRSPSRCSPFGVPPYISPTTFSTCHC